MSLPSYKTKNSYAEWWEARWPLCLTKVMRYITDNKLDPYVKLRMKLRRDRVMMKKDLLQPGESGFQTYYKKQHDELQETDRKLKLKVEEKENKNKKFY